jgi:predicted phage baseplate assembly protein
MNEHTCGCCTGLTTPATGVISNRPGLTAIAYRIGTHAQFKQRLLSRLSAAERASLSGLQTRADDDFTIAFLDAWATVADVLTFYQERLANEAYLRTATERLSLVHLARAIGYEPQPGVAASTVLAFTLEEALGAPQRTTIASGVKVQSVPGPNQQQQTFETVETLEARVSWNALKPQTTTAPQLVSGVTELYLRGIDTQLQPGDGILIIGDERERDTRNEQWDFRILQTVTPDAVQGHTRLTWERGLGSVHPVGLPAVQHPKVFALRQRAALFGHNAPDPNLLSATGTNLNDLAPVDPVTHNRVWNHFDEPQSTQIDLDTVYTKIVPGSWVVLVNHNTVECSRATRVTAVSLAQYALNAKVTSIVPDLLEQAASFHRRDTTVFAQSEALQLAEQPLTTPITGPLIPLAQPPEDLPTGRLLVFSGTDARTGAVVREVVTLAGIREVAGVTQLLVTPSLRHCYVRHSLTINANVARATHGETVQEVLGSGDASQPYQRFSLRQAPLTYVSAPTASGTLSTLQVRVNDVLWQEVPTLYGQSADDHVYVTRTDDTGQTTIQFGDGVMGARLPSGQDNVRATYRKGLGWAGMVEAEQLSLLLTRPLGVRAVANPDAASGAADPESLQESRRNAPLAVLTLERVVSLQDYEDFVRTFAGIAKVLATPVRDGLLPGVVLTIAGPNGVAIAPDSALYTNLLAALRRAGNPHIRLRLESYHQALFRLAGKVQVDPAHRSATVLAAVEAALRRHFAFAERAFGQTVTLSEVLAVMHSVPGVLGVDMDALHRSTAPARLHDRLLAARPARQTNGRLQVAELLLLDPAPLVLEVMP